MKTKTQTVSRIWVYSLAIFCLLFNVQSQSYTVDAGHSSFQSKVIRFGVVPVVGRFNDVSGSITYDPENIEATNANLVIKVASYTANSTGGEDAVKSAAFMDAASYPEMTFSLVSLSGSGDNLTAKGTLEIHGTKKEIECPVKIVGPMLDLPTRKQSIGITGNLIIDRTEYGVGKEMKLPNGNVIIGNEVAIDFVILGIAD